ncbi:MAG: hypothetical protein M0Z51_10430, partial [Propionibacterium sp.]|nr:hypothetical protein [Propionibacterium sp.]
GQMSLMPENFVYLNAVDGERLSLADGDVVEVHAVGFGGTFTIGQGGSHDVRGSVKIVQGLRPGSTSVSWHYGHWAYGARDIEVDGSVIKGETARGRGLCPNPAMAVDDYLKDLCLTDPIAGDSAFSGTKVKLVKVSQRDGAATAMPASGYYSHLPQTFVPQVNDPQTQQWLSAYATTVRGSSTADAKVAAEASRRWRGSSREAPQHTAVT